MIKTCLVIKCDRPVEDAWVCSTCADQLLADLGEIPSLQVQLDVVLARLTAFGDHNGGRSAAKPIPFDARASEAGTALHAVLVSWVRLVLEERGDQGADLPDDDLGMLAVWLIPAVEWLRHHEAGHEAVAEIGGAVERVRTLIDRPMDRWYAGGCEVCGADLYVQAGTVAIVCQCGRAYDIPARRAWLLDRAEDVLANAADMSRALTSLDAPVTAERIRKWRERGRLVEHARDRHGQALYRVGDVRELLARPTRGR